jgi:hypothetical protein
MLIWELIVSKGRKIRIPKKIRIRKINIFLDFELILIELNEFFLCKKVSEFKSIIFSTGSLMGFK